MPCQTLTAIICFAAFHKTTDDGSAIFRAVRRRLLNAKARLQTQCTPCGIRCGLTDNGIGVSPSISVFFCQHSVSVPYSSTYRAGAGHWTQSHTNTISPSHRTITDAVYMNEHAVFCFKTPFLFCEC